MNDEQRALVELGRYLRQHDYRFVTVTPATHERVLSREDRPARDLRDVFGWSRSFFPEDLPPEVVRLGEAAGCFVVDPLVGCLRSTVRFSTLGEQLFVHSAYPTVAPDAVFFGPDTYRFCSFIARKLQRCQRVVDVGCGSGAGGIMASRVARRVVFSDINPAALRMAEVNAALARIDAEFVLGDVLSAVEDPFDAVLANPPYMRDDAGRRYRDGGGAHGEALSLRIVREALARILSGGQLLVYTGAPVVDGRDVFREGAEASCRQARAVFTYQELDPDVFGEELDQPGYADVERIAAVGLAAMSATWKP